MKETIFIPATIRTSIKKIKKLNDLFRLHIKQNDKTKLTVIFMNFLP